MDVRSWLYRGGIKIFRQLPSAIHLCTYFRSSYKVDHSLRTCDRRAEIDEITRFEGSESKASRLWRDIINETGVHSGAAAGSVLWDRVRLRIQRTHDHYDDVSDPQYSHGRFSSTLELHRDTWANNVQQQLNWWMPLVPISAGRTLALYPSYFEVPVQNNSSSWSIKEVKRHRDLNIPYPQLPVVLYDCLNADEKTLLDQDKTPVVIDPGDVLVFSGAHLHGSIINSTGLTRYSSEVRTVDQADVIANIGAPNVDGRCPDYNIQWFRPMS